MHNVIFAAIAIGLLGGGAVGYAVSRRLASRLAASSHHPRLVRGVAGVAGLLALVPSGFLTFVVCGNLAIGVGVAFLPGVLGVLGAPLGLALGLGGVLALCLITGSLFGALLGSGISALVSRAHEA